MNEGFDYSLNWKSKQQQWVGHTHTPHLPQPSLNHIVDSKVGRGRREVTLARLGKKEAEQCPGKRIFQCCDAVYNGSLGCFSRPRRCVIKILIVREAWPCNRPPSPLMWWRLDSKAHPYPTLPLILTLLFDNVPLSYKLPNTPC